MPFQVASSVGGGSCEEWYQLSHAYRENNKPRRNGFQSFLQTQNQQSDLSILPIIHRLMAPQQTLGPCFRGH